MMRENGETTSENQNSENIWEQAMTPPEVPESAEEHEDLSEKEAIADAAADVAEAFVGALTPQVDERGRVVYYISGSVALSMLPRVRTLESFHQKGGDGEPQSDGKMELSDEARKAFLRGARKKGYDFDIVSPVRMPARGTTYRKIMDRCKNRDSIIVLSEKFNPDYVDSTVTMDYLSYAQDMGEESDYSYSKATMEDGSEIYIASPGALIGAKAHELSVMKRGMPVQVDENTIQAYGLDTPEKIAAKQDEYNKAHEEAIARLERDLITLITGFSKMMSREEMIEAAKYAIRHRAEEAAKEGISPSVEDALMWLEEEISSHYESE